MHSKRSVWQQLACGTFLLALFTAITVFLSSSGMPLPDRESELIISFKVEGAPIYADEQDESGRLDHMQRRGEQRVERRSDVVVQVSTAGTVLYEDHYRPKGIFRRGYSSGIIYIPLEPGSHSLEVQFGNHVDGEVEWENSQQREIEIAKGERIVLKFNDQLGFRWYTKDDVVTN